MRLIIRLIDREWVLWIDDSPVGIVKTSKRKVMDYILRNYLKGAVAFTIELEVEHKEVKDEV